MNQNAVQQNEDLRKLTYEQTRDPMIPGLSFICDMKRPACFALTR